MEYLGNVGLSNSDQDNLHEATAIQRSSEELNFRPKEQHMSTSATSRTIIHLCVYSSENDYSFIFDSRGIKDCLFYILVQPNSQNDDMVINVSKAGKSSHRNREQKTSFQARHDKPSSKKVRLRVISSTSSTSRSWYKSRKGKKTRGTSSTISSIENNEEKTELLICRLVRTRN